MKRILLLLALVVATGATYAQTAKVYFIRNTGKQQALINAHLFVDKDKKCTLKGGQNGVIDLPVGEHNFASGFGKSDLSASITVTLEAGKKYYFAFTSDDMYGLYEVTERSAAQLLSKTSEIDCSTSIK